MKSVCKLVTDRRRLCNYVDVHYEYCVMRRQNIVLSRKCGLQQCIYWLILIVVAFYIAMFTVQTFDFYPRDAMLARVIEIATCLSVRPSVRQPSGQLFVVLKTSGNAHTLLHIGLLSNLFVTNIID